MLGSQSTITSLPSRFCCCGNLTTPSRRHSQNLSSGDSNTNEHNIVGLDSLLSSHTQATYQRPHRIRRYLAELRSGFFDLTQQLEPSASPLFGASSEPVSITAAHEPVKHDSRIVDGSSKGSRARWPLCPRRHHRLLGGNGALADSHGRAIL